MEVLFEKAANAISKAMGRPLTFLLCCLLVIVWAASGPVFNFSDTWQLVINTGTTIITFLMVFIIQNTQNRDTRALQIKLSELILALETANNRIAAIEQASPEELEAAQKDIEQRAEGEAA